MNRLDHFSHNELTLISKGLSHINNYEKIDNIDEPVVVALQKELKDQISDIEEEWKEKSGVTGFAPNNID